MFSLNFESLSFLDSKHNFQKPNVQRNLNPDSKFSSTNLCTSNTCDCAPPPGNTYDCSYKENVTKPFLCAKLGIQAIYFKMCSLKCN